MRFLIDEKTRAIIDQAIVDSDGDIDDEVVADFVVRRAQYITKADVDRSGGHIALEVTTTRNEVWTRTQLSLLMLNLQSKLLSQHTAAHSTPDLARS